LNPFSVEQIFETSKPIFNALFPYVVILAVLPLSFWLVSQILQLKNKQTTAVAILLKSFCLMLVIFFWQHIFISAYYLNDAWEARIIEIDLSSVLPGYVINKDTQIMDTVIGSMLSEYEIANKMLASYENQRGTSTPSIRSTTWVDQKKAQFNWTKDATLSSAKKGIYSFFNTVHPKTILRTFIGFLASIAKEIVMMTRIGFSYFFYVAIPFLVVLSYFPVLGDNQDAGGLNRYSKSTD